MNIFLDGPQHFNNLCAVVRTLEVFGVQRCFVYDPGRLVRPRYGKRRRRESRTISAGAFGRVELVRVLEPATWLSQAPGRVVVTVPAAGATPLSAFSFQAEDTIVFGGESQGIQDAILELADARLTIPQAGQTRSLNLSVAVGVVVYAAITAIDAS